MDAFKKAFEGNTQYLANNLEVPDDLIRALFDQRIINREHASKIKKASDNPEKVDQLISILECGKGGYFSTFCDVLVNQNQQHIADKLRLTYD